MDSDLDDILNDGPVAPASSTPSAAAAPASDAPPQTAPRVTPSANSPEVEKAPDVVKPTQEPIVEAAPMSTESAVLVSAPHMGEDSKEDKALDTTPVPTVTENSPPASVSTSEKPTEPITSVSSKPKETTAAEAKNSSSVDDGGWGLSSVTAALGGWGFGGSNDEADTAPTTALGSVEADCVCVCVCVCGVVGCVCVCGVVGWVSIEAMLHL